MKVCVAEKPSVAREITSVLDANTKRDGYYQEIGRLLPLVPFNKKYELVLESKKIKLQKQ